MGFFQGTQERIRNRRGKRAISVRAIEVLLYVPTWNLKEKKKKDEDCIITIQKKGKERKDGKICKKTQEKTTVKQFYVHTGRPMSADIAKKK